MTAAHIAAVLLIACAVLLPLSLLPGLIEARNRRQGAEDEQAARDHGELPRHVVEYLTDYHAALIEDAANEFAWNLHVAQAMTAARRPATVHRLPTRKDQP